MQTLHEKLAALEQDADENSVKPVCKQLVSPIILHHKEYVQLLGSRLMCVQT